MRLFCFAFSSLFLLFSSVSAQTPTPVSQNTGGYQPAVLVKMAASVNVQEHEISHTTPVSAVLVAEKVVSYRFLIRLNGTEYTSEYTPSEREQPGNLPHAWWQGNAPIGIKIDKRSLFLRLPDGRTVQSIITNRAPLPKSS